MKRFDVPPALCYTNRAAKIHVRQNGRWKYLPTGSGTSQDKKLGRQNEMNIHTTETEKDVFCGKIRVVVENENTVVENDCAVSDFCG